MWTNLSQAANAAAAAGLHRPRPETVVRTAMGWARQLSASQSQYIPRAFHFFFRKASGTNWTNDQIWSNLHKFTKAQRPTGFLFTWRVWNPVDIWLPQAAAAAGDPVAKFCMQHAVDYSAGIRDANLPRTEKLLNPWVWVCRKASPEALVTHFQWGGECSQGSAGWASVQDSERRAVWSQVLWVSPTWKLQLEPFTNLQIWNIQRWRSNWFNHIQHSTNN